MTRRIALVGAGAIARAFYLPALAKLRGQYEELWIVDPSETAVEVASRTLEARGAARLDHVDSDLDFIIVATPNSLHAALAMEALGRNAHVLIEKPFVSRPAEGEKLIAVADSKRRLIAVNQTRRYYPVLDTMRSLIADGALGRLIGVDHAEGVKLDWPFESGAAFARDADRTGVIMDFGVHVIDYYHALLNPEWSLEAARHDGFSGPEGLAEIRVTAGMIPIHIRLSRYHSLRNTARLTFENGTIDADVFDLNSVTVTTDDGKARRVPTSTPISDYAAIGELLLRDVIHAIDTGSAPRCDAVSSLPVIHLLDQVYTRADRFPETVGAV